jgi:hypothetical protein
LSPETQEKFKDPVNKPIREPKNLLEFGPFMKWNKEIFNLLTKHNIHVLSIVAHEHEKGRIIDPVVITNSSTSIKNKRYIMR